MWDRSFWFFIDSTGVHGFLDIGGSFTIIDVPGAAFGTAASGINNPGQIVGIFSGDPMLDQRGFLYSGGSFTLLDVPGATQTAPTGINDAGRIVGAFIDITGEHGFLATPVSAVPEASTIALLGVGAIGLGLFRRRSTARFPTTAAPRRTLKVPVNCPTTVPRQGRRLNQPRPRPPVMLSVLYARSSPWKEWSNCRPTRWPLAPHCACLSRRTAAKPTE